MKTLFVVLVFFSVPLWAQNWNVPATSPSWSDTLDCSSSNVTSWYDLSNRTPALYDEIWVTVIATGVTLGAETLRVEERWLYGKASGGTLDSTVIIQTSYTPRHADAIDTSGNVIFKYVSGDDEYVAQFKIWTVFNGPRRIRLSRASPASFKPSTIWYITFTYR